RGMGERKPPSNQGIPRRQESPRARGQSEERLRGKEERMGRNVTASIHFPCTARLDREANQARYASLPSHPFPLKGEGGREANRARFMLPNESVKITLTLPESGSALTRCDSQKQSGGAR